MAETNTTNDPIVTDHFNPLTGEHSTREEWDEENINEQDDYDPDND